MDIITEGKIRFVVHIGQGARLYGDGQLLRSLGTVNEDGIDFDVGVFSLKL